MYVAYLVVSLILIVALVFSAVACFARYPRVIENMERCGVPLSWVNTLGGLKALGALGLVVGYWMEWIAVAAAIGVIEFFVCAVYTHIWAKDRGFVLPAGFGLMGVAALTLRLLA
ncbi:MAG TPA: DoxX family protein [Stackebrandtia sp.]|jgi:hypothetical protein|uniref:DoxX family protein n=1 Tax=Stackebrandtia sp. TaxID=2023065 RepID=UPI002D5E7DCB|nr:DoxX family protein [Stackebrandtia sp.]HZE40330.1 DoxX family protein [Stackebrandtia sp.]